MTQAETDLLILSIRVDSMTKAANHVGALIRDIASRLGSEAYGASGPEDIAGDSCPFDKEYAIRGGWIGGWSEAKGDAEHRAWEHDPKRNPDWQHDHGETDAL